MKVFSYREVKAEEVTEEGAAKTKIRWLIDEKTGAKNFFMRMFEVEPGGYTPLHMHPWEHEIFILEGEGTVVGEEGERKVGPGDVIFIPPNEKHQLKNTGNQKFKFLCLIPSTK
ncbi:MAG: cupin domain-containing protein [Candidatus Baldrarchaeia archaeon]